MGTNQYETVAKLLDSLYETEKVKNMHRELWRMPTIGENAILITRHLLERTQTVRIQNHIILYQ